MWKLLKNHSSEGTVLFLITVALPTLLAMVYFGFVASDVYVSESRVVVRSSQKQTPTSLGMVLQGVGINSAHDDSYSMHEFIASRDALKVLNEKMGLRAAYSSPSVDRLSRFAGIDWDDSFEALHRYYQKMVTVQTDPASSITVITARAFAAQDAFTANRILLEQSEALVNRLNERARQDLITFATEEVRAAEAKAREAAVALSSYRDVQRVVDPERQASVQLQQVAKLQDELIATTVQIAQVKATSPDNPQIQSLKKRAETLRSEITAESAKVAGPGRSLSNQAAAFQRLALERDFADKQLASAMASLESARSEAQRKQVYLARVVQPSLPDMAQEPRRLRNVLATLVLGLVFWGILSMFLAGVREHHD
jgi:capsular polysaccharide transport system permease protein